MNELDQALQLSEKMLRYAKQSVWEQVGQLERQRRGLYQIMRRSRQDMRVEKVKAIIMIDREIVRLRCQEFRGVGKVSPPRKTDLFPQRRI